MLEPKRADVQAIESELAALWRSISEARQGSGAVLRVCLLNLIVVAQSQEEADTATEVIAQVTQDHPCRAIVLFIDPELSENAIEAWVTAHCQLPNEKSEQVCCEQIFIRTSGWQSTGMVAPLLVTDLPVFVWWVGQFHLDSPLSHRLQFLADRWVFDSSQQAMWDVDLAMDLIEIEGIATSDIHWSRLTPWRETIAQFFDPLPHREQIEHLRLVEIQAGDLWQGEMLAGWIASRLDWPLAEDPEQEGDLIRWIVPGRDVVIEIDSVDAWGIESVLLSSDQASFRVEAEPDGGLVATTAFAGQAATHRHIALRDLSLAQYLCGELEVLGYDRVYEESLRKIASANL